MLSLTERGTLLKLEYSSMYSEYDVEQKHYEKQFGSVI